MIYKINVFLFSVLIIELNVLYYIGDNKNENIWIIFSLMCKISIDIFENEYLKYERKIVEFEKG